MTTQELLRRAQAAKPAIILADTGRKNEALLAMAGALEESTDAILEANARDLEAARGTVSEVMLDRLALSRTGSRAWPPAFGRWPPCPTPWARCCAG